MRLLEVNKAFATNEHCLADLRFNANALTCATSSKYLKNLFWPQPQKHHHSCGMGIVDNLQTIGDSVPGHLSAHSGR